MRISSAQTGSIPTPRDTPSSSGFSRRLGWIYRNAARSLYRPEIDGQSPEENSAGAMAPAGSSCQRAEGNRHPGERTDGFERLGGVMLHLKNAFPLSGDIAQQQAGHSRERPAFSMSSLTSLLIYPLRLSPLSAAYSCILFL